MNILNKKEKEFDKEEQEKALSYLDSSSDIEAFTMIPILFVVLSEIMSVFVVNNVFFVYLTASLFSIFLFAVLKSINVYSALSFIKISKEATLGRIQQIQKINKLNKKDLKYFIEESFEFNYLEEKDKEKEGLFCFFASIPLYIAISFVVSSNTGLLFIVVFALTTAYLTKFVSQVITNKGRFFLISKQAQILSTIDYELMLNDFEEESKVLETE